MAEQKERSAFNPHEHIIEFKGKEYLPVAWRLVWFREYYPNGTIETEMILFDPDKEFSAEVSVWNSEKRRSEKVMKSEKGFAMFRAVVKNGQGGIATATKTERGVDFPDYAEKCETGAVGRALAMLGFGTQFTADELQEGKRIVDSSVERNTQLDKSPVPDKASMQSTQPPAPNTAPDPLKLRQLAAFAKALKLGLFTKGETKEEGTMNFLRVVGEALGANITSTGHLTASRLDEFDKYLNSKDVA